MKIEERFAIPFPRERVWDFLHDPAAVVRCLPGAELSETDCGGRVTGRFSIKLGPMAASFLGNAEIAFDETEKKAQITGTGTDPRSGSRARGSASFVLIEEDGGTRVDLVVEYALAGALAQFNRAGIVRDLAARLTSQFAENLCSALAFEAPQAKPAPIDAGNMLGRILWFRLRRWLRAFLGRH